MKRPSALVASSLLLLGIAASPGLAQASWTLSTPAVSPPNMAYAELVYDASRGVCLLFGGIGSSQPLAETWQWDGTNWTQLSPANSPPPLILPRMAYDSRRDRVVLFGGLTGPTTPFGETWEWDGTDWTQRIQEVNPPARGAHALAYDAVRGRVLLFGGFVTTTPPYFNDTWEWDGTSWTQLTPAASPPALAGMPMVFDSTRGRVVLFGGIYDNQVTSDDTWEWDGTTWIQQAPLQRPPARILPGLAYDSFRQRTVCVAGAFEVGSGGLLGDTWDYDGNTWEQRSPSTFELLLEGAAMTFDGARSRVVLFGGDDDIMLHDETWEFYTSTPASYASLGSGCSGTAGTPALAATAGSLPWIGDPLSLQLTNLPSSQPAVLLLGLSSSQLGGLALPFPLDALGMTGCNLYVSSEAIVPLTNIGGTAAFSALVPDDPALGGLSLHPQGFVLDPGANPGGATTSNAGVATFGIR